MEPKKRSKLKARIKELRKRFHQKKRERGSVKNKDREKNEKRHRVQGYKAR